MEIGAVYTLKEIANFITNLDNGITESQDNRMKRVKLPIPEEYGGGWATGYSAEDAVKNLISKIRDKLNKPITDHIFTEYADRWLLSKSELNRSPSTIATYKYLLNTHIKPYFINKTLGDILPDDIQSFFNSIMSLSRSVSVQCKAILKGIFDNAERNGIVAKNPMRFKYEQSNKTKDKTILQDSDLIDIIKQLDSLTELDYIYMCFLCFTSLRKGEILGLRWGDINFNTDTIKIVNNVTYPNGSNEPYICQPKDGSIGVVHLQSGLKERIFNRAGEAGTYVFPYNKTALDIPMTKSMFTKMWRRINKTIDLKGATSHSFRSSYVTMMNAHCSHIDPKVLQGALRHKTPDLAMRVYTKENTNKIIIAEKEYDEWLNSQLKHTS